MHSGINNKINVDHQAAARPPPGVPNSRYSRRFPPPAPACTETESSYVIKYILLPELLQQAYLLVDALAHQLQVVPGAHCVPILLQLRDQAHLCLQAV